MARPRFQNLDRETRHRILETAASEFAVLGFEGASLNGLIGKLGISKGSFYYYFDDKADLFNTVVDHAWTTFLPEGHPDLGSIDHGSFWAVLEEMMREIKERIHDNPWLMGFTRLMYDPPDSAGIRETLAARFDEARRWQAELIVRGQALGAVRDDLPAGLLQALMAGADQAGDTWIVSNWKGFTEDQIEHLFREVFDIYRRMLAPLPEKRG